MCLTVFVILCSLVEPFVAFTTWKAPDSSVYRQVIISGSSHSKHFRAVIARVLDTCVFVHVNLIVSTIIPAPFTLATMKVELACMNLNVAHEAPFVIILFATTGTKYFSLTNDAIWSLSISVGPPEGLWKVSQIFHEQYGLASQSDYWLVVTS